MAVRSSIDSQFNPGQNPYDTYVGLDSAAESIDADIARSQLAQERAEQKRLREMQLADIKSKNMAGLMGRLAVTHWAPMPPPRTNDCI